MPCRSKTYTTFLSSCCPFGLRYTYSDNSDLIRKENNGRIKYAPATLDFMKDTAKKDPEGCGCVGAEALMELEENCAAISAALAG
jgi:hypothetical protein